MGFWDIFQLLLKNLLSRSNVSTTEVGGKREVNLNFGGTTHIHYHLSEEAPFYLDKEELMLKIQDDIEKKFKDLSKNFELKLITKDTISNLSTASASLSGAEYIEEKTGRKPEVIVESINFSAGVGMKAEAKVFKNGKEISPKDD